MALTVSVDAIVQGNRTPALGVRPHWKRIRLREVASVLNGFAFKSAQFTKGDGMPLIRIRDVGSDSTDTNYVGEFDERYIVEPGDLLVGMDGDFNCARWRGPRGLLNQRVCKVTVHVEQYHPRFLDFALPGYLKAINDATSSVTVKHLSSRTIEDIPLPFPPLSEQEEIVAELEKQFSRLDEAVANLKRVKANLKRYKAAVRRAAVEGRLVPTEAELARRERRSYEDARALLDRVQRERRSDWAGKAAYCEPAEAADGWAPSLAEGWALASLEALTSANRVICYGILMPKENVSDGVLYVKVRDMKDDTIDVASLHRTSAAIAAKYTRASLRTGDVLLSIRGTYGRVALVPPVLDGGNITQDTARLAITPSVCKEFVVVYLRSEHAQRYFKAVARGVAVKGVNIGDVRPMPVPVPPLAEQRRIVDEVARRLSLVREVEIEVDWNLARATALRARVLQSFFACGI